MQKEYGINEKRLLSIGEAAAYIGLGTSRARVWLDHIKAERRLPEAPTRLLYDRAVIDRALDEMGAV